MAVLALAVLLVLPGAPVFAQTINLQPAPGSTATPRVEEGGWAGFAVTVGGSAPSADVTVNCVSSQRVANSNRGLVTHLRADGAAIDALAAGDPFPSVSITLGPSYWPSGQTLYCEFWTHDNEVVDGQRFFRMRESVTGPGLSEVSVSRRRDSGDYEFQITDNDATPTGPRTLRFFAVGSEVEEGGYAVFDVVLSRPITARMEIPYTITPAATGGAGITADDFSGGLTGTFILSDVSGGAGTQSGRVRQRSKLQIQIADSEGGEMAEEFTVTLGPPTGGDTPGILYLQRSASMTIRADDAAAVASTTISVSVPDSVDEGDSAEITFTLSRSYPAEVFFGYDIASTSTPAATDADFVGTGIIGRHTAVVPAGATEVKVPLHVLQDGMSAGVEPNEMVTVTIIATSANRRWPGAASPPIVPHSTDNADTFTINNPANPAATAQDFGTVTISESSLLVTQGGQGTYTVVLGAAPGAASEAGTRCVTVTPEILSPTSGTPVTFSPASVTFSSVASGGACAGSPLWSTAQTITVGGGANLGEDAVVVKVGHDVTTVGTANIYTGVAVANGPVVSIPGVPIIPGDLTLSASTLGPVTQGATAQYTVALDSDPGASTVTVTPTGTNLTFSPASVRFSTDGAASGVHQWDSAQTFTVTAANGLGAAATEVEVSHAIAASPDEGLYEGVTSGAGLTVTIAGHGLTLSASALNVRQGGQVTYTMQLDTSPGASIVTVTPSGDNLTFEPANILFSVDAAPGTGSVLWNSAQTVTVTAATGLGTASTMSAVSHAIAAAPNDGPYESSPAIGGLDVTIYGHAGLTLSAATLEVEQGADVTYTVRLDADPGAGNTVTVTPTAAGLTFNPASLTFTQTGADIYTTAKTVTVSAAIDTAPGAVAVSHALSATGGPYNDADIAPDFQGPTVTVTGLIDYRGTTRLTVRQGETAQYAVNLNRDLTDASHTVTITPSATPAGRLTFSPASLELTSSNFFSLSAATIRVTAAAGLGTADLTDTVISHTVAAAAGPYMAVTSAPDLPVTIPGRPGLTLSAAALSGLVVTQGGSVQYDMRLDTDPGAGNSVTVTPTATGLTFDPPSVTFSGGSGGTNPWNTAQTVTITAGASATPGAVAVSHAFTAATGTDYDGAHAYPLPEATIAEAATGGSIVFTEGADTSASITELAIDEGLPSDTPTYTVALSQDPTADATVTVSGGTGSPLRFGEYTVASNGTPNGHANMAELELNFTSANYNMPQRVLVVYTADDDGVTDTVDIMHDAEGGGAYAAANNVSVNLPVTATDDDALSFTISGLPNEITEAPAHTVNLNVRATVQPPAGNNLVGAVTSNIDSVTTGVAVTFTPSMLTFTDANWNTDQPVVMTFTDGLDPNSVDERVTVSVTATSDVSAYAQAAVPGTGQFTLKEPAARNWTVRARGAGIFAADVDEDAPPIASPATADTADNHERVMYFRFVSLAGDGAPPRDTTVTYCLGGGATGGSAAQVAANPRVYDYTWPGNYDPAATMPTGPGYTGDCRGRGSFTVLSTATNGIYRLGVQLNDDSVDEDDETITAIVIATASADGHARVNAFTDVATRTIKDNDANRDFVRIGPKTATATEGDDFTFTVHLAGGGTPAELRVPWTTGTLSNGAAVAPGSGTVVFPPGSAPTQEVNLSISLVEGLDSTAGTQNLEIFFDGNLAGPGARHYQKQRDGAGTNTDLTVDGIVFSGTSTVTISFISEAVQLNPANLSVTEGASGEYEVTLSADPGSGETVTVAPSMPAGLSVAPSSLTFDGAGGSNLWNTAQTVTVTAAEDDDAADAALVITHTVTTTQTTGDYAGFTDPLRVHVAVSDDDTRGVSISRTTLSVPEGAVGFYTVQLDTEPVGGAVLIRPMGFDTGTVTTSVSLLTFTDSAGASPWNVAQTVGVRGEAEYSSTETIHHGVAGADYGGVTAPGVGVTVTAAQSVPLFSIALAGSVADADDATAGVQVGEDVGMLEFTVSVSGGAPTANITVDWAVTGVDTAADLSGYPASGRTLTFTAANHATAQTITLTVNDDSVNEAPETLSVNLGNPAGADNPLIGGGTAAVQIVDNDPLTFAVARGTPADGELDEGGSQSFTITPSGGAIASGASVTVPWFISIDAAGSTVDAAPGDFRATAAADDTAALSRYPRGTLTFTAAGAQTVTVHTRDDSATEGVEAFALYLGAIDAPGAASATGAPVTVQIAASDQPMIIISPTTLTVEEGGTAEYTVRLTHRPTGELGVFARNMHTAIATVSLPGRPTTPPLELGWSSTDENWAEPYTLTVTGVAAGTATITHSTDSGSQYPHNAMLESVTVTVEAPGPRFQIAVASTVTDADMGTDGTQVGEDVGDVAFIISLSSAPTAEATVDWAASGVDTATDLTGYPSARALTFTTANWNAAQSVTLAVADDSLNEAPETLTVTLSNPSGAAEDGVAVSGSAGSAQVQIVDNDLITFTVTRSTPADGNLNEGGSMVFTVTPSGGGFNGATIAVSWAIATDADNTTTDAAEGDFRADGTAIAALANFPSGSVQFTDATAQDVTVWTLNDDAAEPNEVFQLGIGAINGAVGATTPAGSPLSATILSSDQALTITCTAVASLPALEEGMATAVANCSHGNTDPLVADVGVGWQIFAGSGVTHTGLTTATAATDFDANAGSIIIPAGSANTVSVPISITATDDGTQEAAEDFSLVVTSAQDTGGRYAPQVPADVAYAQDLSVAASAAGGPQFGIAVAASVTDADAADGTQVGEDVGSVAFTVSVSGEAPTGDITVTWAVGGVQSGDYSTSDTSPLTFTAANWNAAQSVTISVTDDSVNEATETLTVTLSDPLGADSPTLITASAAVEITDNDDLTFTLARTTPAGTGAVTEGTAMTFTATMTGGTVGANAISLPWSIGGTAASGDTEAAVGDFDQDNDNAADTGNLPSGTLTFAANTAAGAAGAAQTFTVRVFDDTTGELEEAFAVSLGAATGLGLGGTSNAGTPQDVTIAASDVPVFSVSPNTGSTNPAVNSEGGGHRFNIVGSGAVPAGTVMVRARVSGGDAVAGDFSPSGTTGEATEYVMTDFSFDASDYTDTQLFQVFSFDDSIAEGDENFTVTLSIQSGLATIGTATAQGTILLNDFQVGFASTAYSMVEDEGIDDDGVAFGGRLEQACVSVTSPANSVPFPDGVTFSLAVSTADTGSAGSGDYTAITNQMVGPFRNTRRQECFIVEIAHDLLNEGAETFRLELAPPPGQSLPGITINPSQSTVTIPANDPLSVTVTGPSRVEEGASAEFTLAFAPVIHTSPDGMQTRTVTYAPTADAEVTWSIAGTGITLADFTGLASLTTGNSHTIDLDTATREFTFEVAVADEGTDPDDTPETFSLTVTGGTSSGTVQAASSGASSSVQIVAAGSTGAVFTVTGPSAIAEGAADVESTAYTVTLSGLGSGATLGEEVTVAWAVTHSETGGSADADFAAASDRAGSVMFAATADDGDTQTFTITIAADDLNEGDEDFSVQVSAGGTYRAGTAAGTTINDHSADATLVTIARAGGTGASVGEAETATFTIALSGGVRTGVITVPVSFSGLDNAEYDITAPTGVAAADTGVTLTFDLSNSPTATDSRTVTADLLGDMLNEAAETLTLTGAAAGMSGLRIATGNISYAAGGASASVGVTDDDAITVTIANAGTDADGGTTGHQRAELTDATFTVSLTDGASSPAARTSAADITIPYTIGGEVEAADYTDRTATVSADTATNGMLVIPAGQSAGTITIRLLDDGDTDMTEALTVSLTAANPSASPPVVGPTTAAGGGSIAVTGTSAAASATTQIVQSSATRTLTVTGPSTITEDDSGGTGVESTDYTVTLAGANFAGDTTITWAVTHGTTEDADFVAAGDRGGEVIFSSTDTTKTFTLTVAGDDVNEADETFTVNVTAPDTSTAVGVAASTTINDDDAITYSIAADNAQVAEADNAEAEFTVTLSGTSEGDVVIPVGVSGTATSGDDYTAPAATVTVSAGDTTGTYTVALTNDAVAEGDETLIATVAAETDGAFMKGAAAGAVTRSATSGAESATVTILANDPLTVTIARKSGETGGITEAGTTSAAFTVTVTGTSAQVVLVDFSISGTHITADDYDITAPLVDHDNDPATPDQALAASATSGTLTIAAGTNQTGEITIQASDDSEAELAETLSVDLGVSASVGAGTITSSGSATVDITDNDGVTVTVSAATAASVAEGGSFSIPVSVGSAHNRDITFSVAFSSTAAGTDNDAEAADYGTPAGLTFTAGQTSAAITIAAEADNLNEGDETFVITVSATTTGRAGGPSIPVTVGGAGATQTLTVQDNDADAIAVTISKQAPSGNTVNEDGSVTFRVALSGGVRTSIITVPFTLAGLDNAEYAITSSLDNADPAMAGAVPAATATGGVIHFTLSGTPSATDHRDITVDLQGDSTNEATEVLTLTGATAGSSGLRLRGMGGALAYATDNAGAITGNAASIQVTDDDAITYSVADAAAVTEVDAGGTNPIMRFAVSLSGASAGDVTVPYTLGGTATGGGTDYTDPSPLSVTIATGDTGADIEITIAADNLNEGDETITVELGANPARGFDAGAVTRAAAQADYTATGTINDDDAVSLTLSGGGDVNEGGNATVTVTLGAEATGTVTVNYTIGSTSSGADNDAEAADYTNTSGGSITIDTSSTRTGTITIGVNDDTLNEGDETFEVRVANTGTSLAGSVTVSGSPRTFTIKDAAADAIGVTIAKQSPSGNTVDEEASVTFRVTLSSTGSAVRTADLVVPFTVTGLDNAEFEITSPAGIQATATGGDLTFPAPNPSATPPVTATATDYLDITINLQADNLNEAAKTLTITGTAPGATGLRTAGAVAYTSGGNTDGISVTDNANDAIAVRITQQTPASDAAAGENATATFRVALSGGIRTSDIIVPFIFSLGSTLSNAEYAITSALDHDSNPSTAGVVPAATATGGTVSFAATGSPAPTATDHLDITVNLIGDDLNEATETLVLTGVAPGGGSNVLRVGAGGGAISYASGGAAATLNVTDDDDIIYSIDAGPTVAEADTGTPMLTYTARIDHQSAADITIPFTLSGSATGGASGAGRDYTSPSPLTIRIAAGSQSQTVSISTIPDNVNEDDETVIITLGTPATVGAAGGTVTRHATAASYTATGTITDDDSVTATVTTPSGTSVAEGASTTIRVALSDEATGTVRVSYTIGNTAATTDNDAEIADDLTDTSGGSIDIVTGTSRMGDITIAADPDMLNEGDETFTVTISMSQVGVPGGSTVSGGSLTFTITDDPQDAIAVTIIRDGAASRDEAGSPVNFRVTLSSAGNAVRTEDVVVPFAFTGTLSNAEYEITSRIVDHDDDPSTPAQRPAATATESSITFYASASPRHNDSFTVAVDLQGDSMNEATETLIMTGAAPGATGLRTAGGAIGYASTADSDTAQVEVTDDDTATITLSDENDFNEGSNRGWQVITNTASDAAITVNFRVEISGTGGTLSGFGSGTRVTPSVIGGGTPGTGTVTIRSGLSTNLNIRANSVPDRDVENGGRRTVTITLTSAHVLTNTAADAAAGRTINIAAGGGTDATRNSDTADIIYRTADRDINVGLAPTVTTSGSEVNCDADSTADGVQFSEDGSARCRVITFRVSLDHLTGGNFLGDDTALFVDWEVSVTGGNASGASGRGEISGVSVNGGTFMANTYSGTAAATRRDMQGNSLRFERDADGASGVQNCAPGSGNCPAQTVAVTITDDDINEAAQEVVLRLTRIQVRGDGNGAGTGLGEPFRAPLLASDEITISIGADDNGEEGDAGDMNDRAARSARSIRFVVTAAGATASDWDRVDIPFTLGGTAADATDYPADPSMFPAGGDFYTLNPPGPGGMRTLSIDLSAGRSASNTDGEAIAHINIIPQLDDLNEPDETVEVTLSAPGASGYATTGGSGDPRAGGNIVLSGATGGNTATATIEDDDDLTLSIAQISPAPGVDLREGTDVTFRVTLSGMSQSDVIVPWSAAVGTQRNTDASAMPGVDDERPNDADNPDLADANPVCATTPLPAVCAMPSADGGTISGASLTIPAGSTPATADFTIRIRQDARKEGLDDSTAGNEEETVTVTLGALTPAVRGVATGAPAMFNIEENPAATRFLDISVDETSREEGQPVVFTVTLTGSAHDAGADALTVDWAVSGTVEGDDYSGPASGTLDFGTDFGGTEAPAHAGGLTRPVPMTITDDDLNEASETLIITLSNIQGGSCDITADPNCSPPTVSNTESVRVTIAESDPVTYAIAQSPSVDEGATATFTVALSGASEGGITVAFTIDSDGTATGGGADYTDPALTVTVPAGSTSASLEIKTIDDNLNEAAETLIVVLSDETAAAFAKAAESGAVTRDADAADQRQTATIGDNDDIRVSVARTAPGGDDEVEEGADVTFTITLEGAAGGSAGDVSVPWTARMVVQDSASTGPNGDPVSNDAGAPDLTTPAVGATSTDGVMLAGTLTITGGAGATSGTVVITPAADGLGEADEQFSLSLGASTGADESGSVTTGSPSSVTVGINANIAAVHVVNVSVSPTVNEDADTDGPTATGGGRVTFTFSLNTPDAGDPSARTDALVANFTLGGTATGGTDYTAPSPLSVTFPAGDNADQTVTIAITPDRIDDDDETLILMMTGVTDGDDPAKFPGTAAATGNYTVTITDNDQAGIAFSVAGDAMVEVLDGSTETYTVALTSQPASGSVIVTPTVTAVTGAADPSAVTLSPSVLTFTGGDWSAPKAVTVMTADRGVIADADFRVGYAVTANAEAPAYTGRAGGVAVRVKAAVNLLSGPRTGAVNAGVSMGNPVIETAGQSATYPIVLGSRPSADVVITFSIAAGAGNPAATAGDGRGVAQTADAMPRIVRGAALTFTPNNWNTPQNVVVEISEQVRGAYELQASVSGGGADYANVGTRTLHIRVVPPVNRAVDDLNRVILPEVARAMAGLQMSAVGDRLHRFRSGGAGARLSLGGQSTLAGMAAANIQSMAKDGIDWKRMLADSSFQMPLSSGDGGGGVGGGAFWGGGAYRSIGGESGSVDWKGNIVGGHLGFDARVGTSALAGLLVSYNDVEIEDYTYNDTSLTGNPEITGDWLLDMTSVSPYLGWRRGALEGWAMAGYGEGDLEIDERGHISRDDRSLETGVSMHSFGLGVSGTVERDRGREVRVKAEAFTARAEVEDGDDVTGHREAPVSELEVDANRVRLMLEFSRTRLLRSGADFGTSAEFGMRYDGGDGRTGGGSELGLGFHYHGAGGVSLQGRVRGLFGHRADYDDWGVSGSLKLRPGGDGQGLSLAVSPAYGRTADGRQGIWDNGLFASGDSGDGADLRARMEVKAGYGVKAFTDTGLLTPYSNMTFTDAGARTVRLGVEWQTSLGNGGGRPGGLDFGLNLSAKRITADDKAPEDAFVLKGELRF